MGRKGVMISFEWPSESRLLGYIQDKGNANYSTRQFRAMISNVAKECEVDSITIIAHSAGAPIVVNALREIRLLEFDMPADQVRSLPGYERARAREKYRIGRIVLAAPDMDVMAFTNAVHDRFHELTTGIAVYASQKDRALGLSEKLYGNSRLGRTVGKLEVWEKQVLSQVLKIELIDASVAEKQFRNVLGHSYFHRDPWVSSDIGSFILGRSPAERGLVKPGDAEVFWQFPTDYPDRLKQHIEALTN
jgi:esterase/lipase superfamily enzyme